MLIGFTTVTNKDGTFSPTIRIEADGEVNGLWIHTQLSFKSELTAADHSKQLYELLETSVRVIVEGAQYSKWRDQ